MISMCLAIGLTLSGCFIESGHGYGYGHREQGYGHHDRGEGHRDGGGRDGGHEGNHRD